MIARGVSHQMSQAVSRSSNAKFPNFDAVNVVITSLAKNHHILTGPIANCQNRMTDIMMPQLKVVHFSLYVNPVYS